MEQFREMAVHTYPSKTMEALSGTARGESVPQDPFSHRSERSTNTTAAAYRKGHEMQ